MVCDGVMNVLEVSVYIKHKADLHTKADTDPVDLIFVKSITNDLLIFSFFFFRKKKQRIHHLCYAHMPGMHRPQWRVT